MSKKSAVNAGYNLANLSRAERDALEQHKQECFKRWKEVKEWARLIYSGMQENGRMWAERKLGERKDIEAATRIELNLMIKAKK